MRRQSEVRRHAKEAALPSCVAARDPDSRRRGVPFGGVALAFWAVAALGLGSTTASAEPGAPAPPSPLPGASAAPAVPHTGAHGPRGDRGGRSGAGDDDAARPEPEIGGCPYRGRRLELIV